MLDIDSIEGLYLYCVHHHGGMLSKEYKILSALDIAGFRARDSLRDVDDLSEEGRQAYEDLRAGKCTAEVSGTIELHYEGDEK